MTTAARFVLWPAQIRTDTAVGGKARALAELSRAGLPVPDWFVIPATAFQASLDSPAADALAAARTAPAMRAAIASLQPSRAVRSAIEAACASLSAPETLFAVRSSAPQEDSAAHSFAGQLESFLNVAPDAVAERVADVWRSGFGDRIVAYRQGAGLDPVPAPPSVVVQRMVSGEVSGVAFSADPVSGRRGVIVVTALPGLGSALVSGAATGDTWRVRRDGQILERTIADKNLIHRPDAACREGLRTVHPPPEEARRACLNDAGVDEVARLAIDAERHFGRPQDIEWTFADGRLHLLQSRPITGLAERADPDGQRAIWDNANIIESYSGITTPLTFSFARRAYEHVYREFCRLMRLSEALIEERSDMFCCMLGLIRGRVYYNLFNWYRLVAILPGYAFNRRFMEQMMGVRESLGDELATDIVRSRSPGRLGAGLRLAATLWGLSLAYLGLNRRVQRFYQRLDDTLGQERPDLSRLRPDELVAYARRLERGLLTHWDAPIVNDFATMIFYGVLRRLTRRWIGDTAGTLQNDLLSGEQSMVSTEPARIVKRMAEMSAGAPQLVQRLCDAEPGQFPALLQNHPDLLREVSDYLERFGERCQEELKLESPTLHDDPSPLLRAVGQYAHAIRSGETRAAAAEETTPRRQAQARVKSALARHPLRHMVFNRVLASTRARVRERENLRFERTRVFGRARMIALELGRRLAALDCLEHARDVFYLEWDEMIAFVEGRATTTDLAGLVAVRRREFEQHARAPEPAERFETRGVVYRGNSFSARGTSSPPEGDRHTGIGCSPGLVRGAVRLIHDPGQAWLRHGEIIVAERTDPGWVMIFPAASGLLVERGSLLSHSAIVARELGLPTIVALPGLTRWLKNGDWVEMDGATGVVARLPPTEIPRSQST
jgi:phosphohistidine swiveling domain-containing protein